MFETDLDKTTFIFSLDKSLKFQIYWIKTNTIIVNTQLAEFDYEIVILLSLANLS